MCVYLVVARRINVTVGPHEKRMLITGLHTVADIYCFDCEVRAFFCVRRKKGLVACPYRMRGVA